MSAPSSTEVRPRASSALPSLPTKFVSNAPVTPGCVRSLERLGRDPGSPGLLRDSSASRAPLPLFRPSFQHLDHDRVLGDAPLRRFGADGVSGSPAQAQSSDRFDFACRALGPKRGESIWPTAPRVVPTAQPTGESRMITARCGTGSPRHGEPPYRQVIVRPILTLSIKTVRTETSTTESCGCSSAPRRTPPAALEAPCPIP